MSIVATSFFVVAVVVIVSAWTIVMTRNDTPGDTVSETLRRWATSHPFVPFALGTLCGHWLAPSMPSPEWGLYALGGVGAGMLAGAIARPVHLSRWQVLAVFAGGILAGGLLWSQSTP